MPAYSSPQRLHDIQLQRALESANTTFSEDQVQILEREIQKTMANARLGNLLKRKAHHFDDDDCSSLQSKPCARVSERDAPAELLVGKYMCETCSQWVALEDDKGFTLAPWVAHVLVCRKSKPVLPSDKGGNADSENGSQSQPSMKSSSPAPSSSIVTDTPVRSRSTLRQDADALLPNPETHATTLGPGVSFIPQADAALLQTWQLNTRTNANPTTLGIQSSFATNDQADVVPKKKRRPNRTEGERREELLADPDVAEVEPYRILCAVCHKWIKLRRNSRYCPIPWYCHKNSCQRTHAAMKPETATSTPVPWTEDRHSSPEGTARIVPPPSTPHPSQVSNPSITHQSLIVSQPTGLSLPPANAHPSLQIQMVPLKLSAQTATVSPDKGSDASYPKPKTLSLARLAEAEQRRSALEADPHSEVVEHDRILCSLCKKWVKLRPNSSYCSAPWRSHISRCVLRNERHEASGSGSNQATSNHSYENSLEGDTPMTPEDHATMSYYRENYNSTLSPDRFEDKPKASYYKNPVSPSSSPQRKRRGRPPKVKVPEPKPARLAAGSDSEISYESEDA